MARLLRCVLFLQISAILHAADDFRQIAYQDLAETKIFHEKGVTTYSQLLFDIARQQVVVGARDNLYRLTLSSLTALERASWPAAKEKVSMCQDKGQSTDDCHNYIKVLLSNGKSLFTCGTNAFSPQCTWREIQNITTVTNSVSGVATCPYSPHANVTALLSRGPFGGLFTGAPADFSGADAAIFRTLASPNLRTRQYDSKWLNDPQFVGSFETEEHVYFIFRESAVEYINCGKRIYSRIARICKNDQGGQMGIGKGTWSTFAKARLNCSLPGEFPFYFDEIQGAAYLPGSTSGGGVGGIVYATFSTPNNAIAGSAICAFNMSAIEAAFNGPFKHQENSGAAWEPKDQRDPHHAQRCGGQTKSAAHQIFGQQLYQLMDRAVQSTQKKPLHTAILERYTHIAVDVTPTKLYSSLPVLYVATVEGHIKKISVLSRTMEACVVEVWGPLPSKPIILQYLKETKSLYVGMTSGLLRIPTVQCHRHGSMQACLNAQEPYCGWDEHLMKCTPAPTQTSDGYLAQHWRQEVTRCPVLTDPVDGGWSSWSEWHTCEHHTADTTSHDRPHHREIREEVDTCQCQTRECNNPPPQHGGKGCTGMRIRVSNCTVHGGWTAWSPWSTCSQTCGFAIMTRRRTCTNPAPAFGGRVCVGHDHDDQMCVGFPPCPQHTTKPLIPQNGQWSAWGPWSGCSRGCGGGVRRRMRSCDNPPPKDGGAECTGCGYQFEDCNTERCEETKRFSSWTPWLAVNASRSLESSGYTEKRFRFICRAQTEDPSSIRLQQAKEEERYCRNDGTCNRRIDLNFGSGDIDGGYSDWSSWSQCTRPCGGGTQYKEKLCESPTCGGRTIKETRNCNTHMCHHDVTFSKEPIQWSCWSDWSPCSVSCGFGVRKRTRECLLGTDKCGGQVVQTETCEMPSCEWLRGWNTWSQWSSCDVSNQQHRRRKCLLEKRENGYCQGPSAEVRQCIPEYLDNEIISELPLRVEMAGVSVGAVVGSCLVGFLIGLALTAFMCFMYLKRRKPRIPGSPHYISKQNPYVTVPLKEVKQVNAKRQPSFSGSINGTLRSKVNTNMNGLGSPKLYPKSLDYESATLKRNSREQHIRAELDQEKYY